MVVVQDVRGQGKSDGGAFYMFRDEFDDGYDTVEWVAAQPFCNGRVGCYGTSYAGNTSWQAAIVGATVARRDRAGAVADRLRRGLGLADA